MGLGETYTWKCYTMLGNIIGVMGSGENIMPSEHGTLGWLIETVLNDAGLSVDHFVDMYGDEYGFTRSSVFRWRGNKGKANDLPYPIIEALSRVAKKPPAEMFLRLGIDIFRVPLQANPKDITKVHVYPLVNGNLVGKPELQEAVRLALYAQELYLYEGGLPDVLRNYEDAAAIAGKRGEFLLASYIRLQVANILEMTGSITEAKEVLERIRESTQVGQKEAQKSGNEQQAWLGIRLATEAEVRWLWTSRWAAGITEESLVEGRAFTKRLVSSPYSLELPHNYVFMARCAVECNQIDEALHYLELAETRAFASSKVRIAPTRLFLDINEVDETWGTDNMLATKADILISAGMVDLAFQSYRRIKRHRNPGAMFCIQHWFDPSWQQLLKKQSLVTDDIDPKLLYTFNEWDEELEASGDLRVQSLITYSQGENDYHQQDYLLAGFRYERARELAERCSADDVIVNAGASASLAAALDGNRELAERRLNMIHNKIHIVNNPVAHTKYQHAMEAIRQL